MLQGRFLLSNATLRSLCHAVSSSGAVSENSSQSLQSEREENQINRPQLLFAAEGFCIVWLL